MWHPLPSGRPSRTLLPLWKVIPMAVCRLGPPHNFSFSLFIFVPRPACPSLPQEEVFIMLEDAPVPLLLPLGCVHPPGACARTHRGTRPPNQPFRYCLRAAAAPSTDQKNGFFDKDSASQKKMTDLPSKLPTYMYTYLKKILFTIYNIEETRTEHRRHGGLTHKPCEQGKINISKNLLWQRRPWTKLH